MIGKIIEINNNTAIIELTIDITKQPNLVGLHIVFEDNQKKIVGEIKSKRLYSRNSAQTFL